MTQQCLSNSFGDPVSQTLAYEAKVETFLSANILTNLPTSEQIKLGPAFVSLGSMQSTSWIKKG